MRKSKKIAAPKRDVYSFVVDGKSEIWYLKALQRNEKSLRINLLPKLPEPNTLKEQYDMVRTILSQKDSKKIVWIVDFDVINKETHETKRGQKTKVNEFKEYYQNLQRKDDVVVIVNNPCLEFWFLLHFADTDRFYENYEKLLPDLQKYLSDYAKTEKYFVKTTPDIYKNLRGKLADAVKNAKKYGAFDFENTQKGISEMWKLVETIGIK